MDLLDYHMQNLFHTPESHLPLDSKTGKNTTLIL
jgi:hypothetical protein